MHRLGLAASIVVAAAMAAPLRAQPPPPLTVIAPAAPGGGWDQTARAMQQALRALDPAASIQVENVPGAAGTIGLARFVTGERGNPHALMVTGLVMVSAIITNHAAVSLAATTPIARLTGEYEVIVVPPSSPYRTMEDLLAAVRRAPGSVAWGGGSAGGTDDLLVRLIAEAAGVPPAAMNYIAFAGGGEALAAVLGGQVTAGVSGLGEFAAQIAAGQLRALAVSAPRRLDGVDIPTLRDADLDLDLANWRAVVAPPGLSDAERDALAARVQRLAESAAWHDVLTRFGWTDLYLGGPAFRQFLLAEQARVDAVLRRLAAPSATAAAAGTTARGRRRTLGPRATATAALVFLGVVATLAAWQVARQGLPRAPARAPAAGLLAAALFAQAPLLPIAGFVPVSAALFVVTARLLGSTRPRRDVAIGVALALVLFVVFTRGLGVSLPGGAWTRLLPGSGRSA